jgi:predicted TPR repeat methyltransferase
MRRQPRAPHRPTGSSTPLARLNAERIAQAKQLQQRGRLDEAEAIYRQLLARSPQEPEALHFFGVLRSQQARHREALNFIAQSLALAPGVAATWANFALVLIEVGEYDEAEAAMRRVTELDPGAAQPYNNWAVVQMRRGDFPAAEASLQAGLARDPQLASLHYNLASLCQRTGRQEEAVLHARRHIQIEPASARARKLLSRALERFGRHEEAVENLREWAAQAPGDPEPLHYLAAYGAAPVPTRASDGYVRQLFDRFAGSFEEQLDKLGYQAPQLVCAVIERERARLGDAPVVLDAGCGTGWCGPLLRPLAARLEGVDLSPGMLARAAQRGVYDELTEAELVAHLGGQPVRFDAVVAADVLNYFGELAPVFGAVAGALRPGGVFVFTVEAADAGVSRYALAVHGRYSHAQAHVEALLGEAGLELLAVEQQVLRMESQQPVAGLVFSVQRG